MSARDQVLARIRTALGPQPHVPEITRAYRTTGDLDIDEAVALFAERVDDYRANVHTASPSQLASLLAGIVADHNHVVAPTGLDGGWLTALKDGIEVFRDGDDSRLTTRQLDRIDVVVTAAAVAIAETGTIVLDGDLDQGRRALTLVPDHHVCVVRHSQVVAAVPDALARLDATRPLTFISGPSATSDIELDRVEGVHGPRILDVVVLDDR